MIDFFIGDLHAGDSGILVYENRPFSSTQEMDEVITGNWNGRVSDDDRVFLLGDIGDPNILRKLKGNIIIILGNHDDYDKVKAVTDSMPERMIEICRWPIMDGALWLSHAPIGFMPPQIPYLNIHAHTHSFSYGLLGKDWGNGNRYFCASVEQIGYTPISIDEIALKIGYHSMK